MSNIITRNQFNAHLSRMGKAPAMVDAMARYAVFHGAQGQFNPVNQLIERLTDGGVTRGDLGRAALDMLNDGLSAFAVTGVRFKGRKGAEYMGEDGARAHAGAVQGIAARIQGMVDARAASKDKRAADKVAAAAAAPADGAEGDDGAAAAALTAANAAQAGTLESRVSDADRSEIVAQAVAEHVEYVRIARSNAARAYALQCKAEQETLDAVRARDSLAVELETVRAQLAEVEARYSRLVAQETADMLSRAGIPAGKGAKRSRAARPAVAA